MVLVLIGEDHVDSAIGMVLDMNGFNIGYIIGADENDCFLGEILNEGFEVLDGHGDMLLWCRLWLNYKHSAFKIQYANLVFG